ncbi:hypothetical protein Tco_1151643, partial [Tanacetum coccineum]
EKLKDHERVVSKMSQSIQIIHMLGTKSNSLFDPNMKTGLEYQNLDRLKKATKAQPKLYNEKLLSNDKVNIDLYDYEETLKEAEESRLKMEGKMIQVNYAKLNSLYETFVSRTELYVEQNFFLTPFTSNVTPKTTRPQNSSSPPKEMPKISKLLKMFANLENGIKNLDILIDQKLEITKEVQEMLDIFESIESEVDETSKKQEIFQNEIDRLLEATLAKEVRNCVEYSVEQLENEKLRDEIEKISNDSKDVQANLLKRIVILENDV